MAELSNQERLQPSLIDRLTDSARVKARIALRLRHAELDAAGVSDSEVSRWLAANGLEPQRSPDGKSADDDGGVQHYEARLEATALNRLFERPITGPSGQGTVPLRQFVDIVDRQILPNTTESRRERVISGKQLRESVLRDLGWLLNTGNLESVQNLSGYPGAATSVVNYGIPEISGSTVSNTDAEAMAARLKQAIETYEPRLRRVRVIPATSDDYHSGNLLSFMVEAELWGQPTPEQLFLHTEMDLETANVTLRDTQRSGDG